MKLKLENIATFQSGLFLQSHIHADAYYLQANHFNEFGKFESSVMPLVNLNKISEKHVLNKGDVLFAAKGLNNFSVAYDESIGKAVASSTFIILRIQHNFKNKINPEYLVWFLNQSGTREILHRHSGRSTIVSVSMQNLKTLEINIPDIKTQDLIIRIQNLRNREKELQKQLATLKDTFIQKQLLTASK